MCLSETEQANLGRRDCESRWHCGCSQLYMRATGRIRLKVGSQLFNNVCRVLRIRIGLQACRLCHRSPSPRLQRSSQSLEGWVCFGS